MAVRRRPRGRLPRGRTTRWAGGSRPAAHGLGFGGGPISGHQLVRRRRPVGGGGDRREGVANGPVRDQPLLGLVIGLLLQLGLGESDIVGHRDTEQVVHGDEGRQTIGDEFLVPDLDPRDPVTRDVVRPLPVLGDEHVLHPSDLAEVGFQVSGRRGRSLRGHGVTRIRVAGIRARDLGASDIGACPVKALDIPPQVGLGRPPVGDGLAGGVIATDEDVADVGEEPLEQLPVVGGPLARRVADLVGKRRELRPMQLRGEDPVVAGAVADDPLDIAEEAGARSHAEVLPPPGYEPGIEVLLGLADQTGRGERLTEEPAARPGGRRNDAGGLGGHAHPRLIAGPTGTARTHRSAASRALPPLARPQDRSIPLATPAPRGGGG
jgi:hypothetical protein